MIYAGILSIYLQLINTMEHFINNQVSDKYENKMHYKGGNLELIPMILKSECEPLTIFTS